ncbi:MAG: DUF3696 domain-containing protein [Pseudomonadota bacterium]
MINKLHIRGYKSLQDTGELFVGNLNVLVGANASGKSSFLQSLLLLRQSSEGDKNVTDLHLSGPLYEAGTVLDVLHPAAEHSLSFEIGTVTGSTRHDFVHDRDHPLGTSSRLLKSVRPYMVPRGLAHRGNHFAYLNAERVGPRVTYELPSDDANLSGLVGKYGQFTAAVLARSQNGSNNNMQDWPDKQNLLFPPDKDLRDLLAEGPARLDGHDLAKQIRDTDGRIDLLSNIMLGWVIPGATFQADELAQADAASLRFIRDPNGTKSSVRSTHIGFGLSYALPIIVAALSLHRDGIILVENPEAHLHPYSQSRMGSFLALLAGTGRQIFIETHSDHLVNGIRLAIKKGLVSPTTVVFNFFQKTHDSDASSIQQIRPDPNGKLSTWPEGFFDQIENDLAQL